MSAQRILDSIDKSQRRQAALPEFRPGDSIKVWAKIREGEKIVMWYPSINHDEDIFDEPFTFDVGRSPNDHLAFGTGEHFCLGAQLARLELLVTYEELMKRAPRMELAGEPARLRSNFIGGIKHLPVKFNL